MPDFCLPISEPEKTFPPAGVASLEKSFSPPGPALKSVRKGRRGRLKPTQQAFIAAYVSPESPAFGNGRHAYQVSHPTCQSENAAAVSASRTLRNDNVQAELASMGWSKERLESELSWNIETCKTLKKMSDHREGTMALAKLRGEIIDKSEVKHLDDETKHTMRRLIAESMRERPLEKSS